MKSITIQSARIVGPLLIDIEWNTGETLQAHLAGGLKPPFDALHDQAVFGQMRVDDWGGHGLSWPEGLDIGADTLYALCREQAGLPTAHAFDDWMKHNGLSLATAADALGMTRRMIAHYRTGSRPIPKVVGLACKGWEAEKNHASHA
jgi:hypothetical protein